MTHEEQRIWLIKELQKDRSQLSHYRIPNDEQGQKDLLRGLMNIWMPKPISEEYLRIESEYLRAENEAKGIKSFATPPTIWHPLCSIIFIDSFQPASEATASTSG